MGPVGSGRARVVEFSLYTLVIVDLMRPLLLQLNARSLGPNFTMPIFYLEGAVACRSVLERVRREEVVRWHTWMAWYRQHIAWALEASTV